MTTNTFKVTYASGVQTEVSSTCGSVEAFCNEHFGSTWDAAKENGASVVMNGEGAPAAEPEADAKPRKRK